MAAESGKKKVVGNVQQYFHVGFYFMVIFIIAIINTITTNIINTITTNIINTITTNIINTITIMIISQTEFEAKKSNYSSMVMEKLAELR